MLGIHDESLWNIRLGVHELNCRLKLRIWRKILYVNWLSLLCGLGPKWCCDYVLNDSCNWHGNYRIISE